MIITITADEEPGGGIMAKEKSKVAFTRVPNQLLEALAHTDLNMTESCIVHAVMRYTLGFDRDRHALSLSYLAKATGKHRVQLGREMTGLIERNIIVEYSGASFNKSRELGINLECDQWELKRGQATEGLTVNSRVDTTVNSAVDKSVNSTVDQDRKSTERKTERAYPVFEAIWKQYPEKKGKSKVTKKAKQEFEKLGLDKMQACLDRYIAEVEKERASGFKDLRYKHGSTFFNSGYMDYLEPKESEQPKELPKRVGTRSVILTPEEQEAENERRLAEELEQIQNCRKLEA